MNRTTVVFLAVAVLLAHTLAIHQTPRGEFAAPYEQAHVAFRLGRQLVWEGSPVWSARGPWIESYPSVLWVALAAVTESFYLAPTLVSQAVGILCALTTVVVVAQFSSKRMAGLIAPLLLAASGSAAAAAASGTEAPLAMLLLSMSFLAFERGQRRILMFGLSALMLTRPEAGAILLGFCALEALDRPRDADGVARASMKGPLAVALLIGLVLILVRRGLTGFWLSPFTRHLMDPGPDQWMTGLHYLASFFYASGSGLLVVFPLALAPMRWLEGIGRRSLLLFATWAALVTLAGGDRLPFWNALAPALPLLFLSIQDAFCEGLDRRPLLAPVAGSLLVAAVSASFLVSKVPGDLGRLPIGRALARWMEPSQRLEKAFDRPLGRRGLLEEIRETERLRPLGIFLRDEVSAEAKISTFWPGAIGYLSRKDVRDILARVQPSPKGREVQSWAGKPKVDLIEALESDADYVVPMVGALPEGVNETEFLELWLSRFDLEGGDSLRQGELVEALKRYELVSVPIPARSEVPDVPSTSPFLLLRKQDLNLTPKLELVHESGSLEVYLRHEGHQQVVDVAVRVIDGRGESWSLRPNGIWAQDAEVVARADLLVYDTGRRPVRVLTCELPPGVDAHWLVVRLQNPGLAPSRLSALGSPAVIRLR